MNLTISQLPLNKLIRQMPTNHSASNSILEMFFSGEYLKKKREDFGKIKKNAEVKILKIFTSMSQKHF